MPERTRLTILHAFDRLVERVGFSKITVSMLVKEAGVSRATFYRYFKDKYDVMNYNYKQMVDTAFTPERIDTLEDLFLIFYQMEAAKKIVEENWGRELNETERLKLRVFAGGCSYMYEDWIRGKYEMSPEEAAHALYMVVPEEFQGYLWGDERS